MYGAMCSAKRNMPSSNRTPNRVRTGRQTSQSKNGARRQLRALPLYGGSSFISKINSPFYGLPQQLTVKLRYYENTFTFDLGSSDMINYVQMALNDPYDPFVALGGKSANEFIPLMKFYRWAKVNCARITVRATQPGFEANRNMLLGLYVNPNQDSITNADDLFSQDSRIMTKAKTFTDIISNTLTVTKEYRICDALRYTPMQYEAIPPNVDFYVRNTGSTISSPNKLAYLDIVYARVDENQSNAISFRGDVTIDFEVTFFDKITQTEDGQ